MPRPQNKHEKHRCFNQPSLGQKAQKQQLTQRKCAADGKSAQNMYTKDFDLSCTKMQSFNQEHFVSRKKPKTLDDKNDCTNKPNWRMAKSRFHFTQISQVKKWGSKDQKKTPNVRNEKPGGSGNVDLAQCSKNTSKNGRNKALFPVFTECKH